MNDLLKHVEYIYYQCERYKPIGTVDDIDYHLQEFKKKLKLMEDELQKLRMQSLLREIRR